MGKPSGDIYIDDKGEKDENFFNARDNFVPKGWGFEKWFHNSDKYCGKLLYFVKGKCSWHYHKIKDEVFYVQSGKIIVYYSDGDDINKANVTILEPGDNFHVYRIETQNGSSRRH